MVHILLWNKTFNFKITIYNAAHELPIHILLLLFLMLFELINYLNQNTYPKNIQLNSIIYIGNIQ